MKFRNYWITVPLVCAYVGGIAQQPVPHVPPPQIPQGPQTPPRLPTPIDPPPPPHTIGAPPAGVASGSVSPSDSYSTRWFAATFNGAVTKTAYDDRNEEFSSRNGDISQSIFVHQETQDVPVNQTTTDLHASRYLSNKGTLVGEKTHGSLGGHPYTYEQIRSTEDGRQLSHRAMFVVVTARVQLRILQVAPTGLDDNPDWLRLIKSSTIK